MRIALDAPGLDALAARVAGLPAALRLRLRPALAFWGEALLALVQEKLSGEVLQSRSGRLRDSVGVTVSDDPLGVSVAVDEDAAPYAAAQEFGASIPAQLILAKNAKALSFVVAGRRIFARSVQHPAFVLPERSFLRSSLAELGPDILAGLAAALDQAVEP